MKKIIYKSWILVLILLVKLGIGFNYTDLNPAYLENRTRLYFLTEDILLVNNTFRISDYTRHFNSDPNWDSSQKIEILSLIPVNGFTINSKIGLQPIAFYSQYFNIAFYAQHFSQIHFDKDVFEIGLLGNELNREYNFTGNEINSINYFGVAFGINYPLVRNFAINKDDTKIVLLKQLNIGARLHYQKGVLGTSSENASGYVYTTPSDFYANLSLDQIVAENGQNWALDIGSVMSLPYNLSFGFALLNINSGFHFREAKHQMYSVTIDSFSVGRYLDFNSIDSFLIATDSSFPIDNWTAKIPMQITSQLNYQLFRYLLISLYYHQYLQKSYFIGDYQTNIGLKLNYQPIRFFNLGFNLAGDLKDNFMIGQEIGFFIKGFQFKLTMNNYQGYLKCAKGFEVTLSMGQQF